MKLQNKHTSVMLSNAWYTAAFTLNLILFLYINYTMIITSFSWPGAFHKISAFHVGQENIIPVPGLNNMATRDNCTNDTSSTSPMKIELNSIKVKAIVSL